MDSLNKIQALSLFAGVAAIASTFPDAVKSSSHIASSDGYTPSIKHVCGWKNGKGKKRVDRNRACTCGSGKKAKH